MISPRLRAGLVIGAVVVASAIAGAAADRAFLNQRSGRRNDGRHRPPQEQESRRRTMMLDRLTKDLTLTPVQRSGIDSIFQRSDSLLRGIRREMQPRLQQVFENSRVQINARLDSAQRVKFAKRRPHGSSGGGRGDSRGGGYGGSRSGAYGDSGARPSRQ